MTMFPITPVSVERVLQLDGKRYFLATSEQANQIEGIRRSWDVKHVPRQEGDPEQEFTVPLTSFHNGYGYTFAGESGVYEIASGWDLSAPGKAITYPRLTTAAAQSSTNYRGWLYWSGASGYMYMLRGSYATKYLPDDSATTWAILERHYFGANIVVAGRPAEFQGKLYVPLVDISTPDTEVLARWHELDTFSTTAVETQVLTEGGSPTGGTFTVTFNDGLTTTVTTALAWDISAAAMQTALRLIPGLEGVTVTRTGASNFVWTVVMTGAPSALGTTSPPQFTANAASLTPSGTITPSTSVAGTGDRWDRSDAAIEARTFTTWQKPTVGPVLVRANANKVSTCSTTPTTAANWGTEQEVGDTGADITALTTLGRLLFVMKEDGVWSLDETGQGINEIPAISAIRDANNGVGTVEYNGYLLIPHKIGLIRWRPGSSWGIVGAEQEGVFEGERSFGWGSVAGLAPYGKYCYHTVNDLYNSLGVVASLQAPGGPRGSLTPHMHQSFSQFVEDCAIVGIRSQPITADIPDTWSDDSAVGTITWSNPANAASEGTYASAAEGGTTHYLKGLNPNPVVPTGGVIKGIRLEFSRLAFTDITTTTFGYTGAEQTYVVPAGITSLLVDIQGAQGGDRSGSSGSAGLGGRVQTRITVTPAETLRIYVGGLPTAPAEGLPAATGGYNGGGNGGGSSGYGGGGASDIRQGGAALANRIVVAGGGGGAGVKGLAAGSNAPAGGAGGGTTGGTGGTGTATGMSSANGGGGGTQSAGGGGPNDGENGSLGLGGAGGNGPTAVYTQGGGGGGGYYGGGGGSEGYIVSSSGPSGGGGGGSSFVSSGTGTVHTQGFRTGAGQVIITAGEDTACVDTTVRLVKAGTVVGDNKAATTTQWPNAAAVATYGSATDLWGTTWTAAEVNASNFGFVLSATVTNGEARVSGGKMYIYYTVSGVSDPGSFLAVITLDSTRVIATPYIYKLPRSGMPAANDPNINKATSDATFKTARYIAPARNTQKEYRSVEFWIDLAPEVDTPGFQLWASVDDSDFFPLLNSSGVAATITTSGHYELFFPQTASALGRWVQLRPTIPALTGNQVAVSTDLRDITIHGAWLPKMTEEVQAVLILKEGGQFEDGYTDTRTVAQQLSDLDALHSPRSAGQSPVRLHDPVRREDTRCVVTGVDTRNIRFKNSHEESHVAILKIRKAVYE